MLNIIPDLEQFSLGEPGGPVSMNDASKKSASKKSASKNLVPEVAPVAPKKCGCKRKCAGKTTKVEIPNGGYPALDAGPSGPMLNFGFQDAGPSGPMFQDGPSGPSL